MTVKIREVPKGSGKWWIKIDYHQRRKSLLCGSQQEAVDAADGIEKMLEAYGEKALEVLENRRRAAAKEKEEKPPVPTVKEFAERWETELEKRDLKFSTRVSYRSNLKHHIVPALGGLPIDQVDYAICKQFVLSKVEGTYSSARFRRRGEKTLEEEESARIRTYSRDTVRIMVMTLRALMGEAVRERLIQSNPVSDLSRFYRRRREERAVRRSDVYTVDELYQIEDILRTQPGKFESDAYEFFLCLSRTGMRVGEARGLRSGDLDYEARAIEIARNIPSGTGRLEESTKGKVGRRRVDMGRDVFTALQAMEARRREAKLAAGKKMEAEWLFSARSGAPMDYSRLYDDWRRANRLAGVRFRSPHSLRHTYASVNLSRGEDLAYVAKQLGHANPAITLAIYTHFMPSGRRREAGALDRETRKPARKIRK